MAKEPQVRLLPMVVEGPTYMSALTNAAIMITASVYLLLRSSALIEKLFNSTNAMFVIRCNYYCI
jgi:NADH:ubiquinone oxidoreductase subunit 5 (subunit L)/multisubunit Na+/H+ antiporter MnhA subunit